MNYNLFSSIGLDLIDDQINSRAKLDTGTHCNYECGFCYYLDKLDVVTDLEVIKKRALNLRNFGMKEIDLSGGESSIHANWFEILDYCRELGFKNISALTNGSRFANFEFIKKSYDHGLTELLISLQGWDSESHAQIVKRKGSFEKILKTIEHAKKLGMRVRLNCTVTHFNAPHLETYATLVNQINPYQINFLPLNYWEDATKLEAQDYEVLAQNIKKSISLINKNIEINARYIPYCFMENFEKYVVGIYQHIFDQGDWNIIGYNSDNLSLSGADIVDYFEEAKKKRMHTYTKEKECFDCKYFHICDGVEHEVSKTQKVYPIKGEKIKDVMHFRRGHYPNKPRSEEV